MRTASILLLGLATFLIGQSENNAAYLNPDLPPEQRAANLVSLMTLDEKVRQMQNSAPAIPRLGIPAYDWWNEALHGVARAGEATVFPQAIGLAATWDTDLMFRVADVISTEARAKYNEAIRLNDHSRYHGLTFWSPNINIFRDPRWGRGQETYGEDPFLTGRLAVAFIKGMQGNDPKYYKVIATAKHFAVHSGPESTRHSVNINPTERDFNETYLPAFRASILEGKADSVMCAYNSVNGSPACANADLLQNRLRGEWKFQGYIVSDCGAIRDIYQGHKVKSTAAEASVAGVKTGTDLTCGNEYVSLVDAVQEGQVTEAEIDRSLERLFVARFKLGMFDPSDRVPFSKIPYSENASTAHKQLALEAARKSIVLLKNDKDTLPLKTSVRKIAVIGPSADDPDSLLGNYNGFSQHQVAPLEGIQSQFAGKAEVRFALGSTYTAVSQALVSADVLTPPNGNGRGVLAEYFDNADLQNQPKLQRVEGRPYLAAIADPDVRAAGIPAQGYSVRWSGTIRAPFTGEYVFGARGGGQGLRVFVDGKDVLANATVGLGRVREGRLPLEAGRSYPLRVEYRPMGPAAANAALVWIPPAEALVTEAVDAVKNADIAIVCLGLNPSLEGEEMQVDVPGFSGGDRTDLNLPAAQEKLLEAVAATGKPLVVVLTSGSAVAINYAAEHARAILAAWYGGEQIGTAIADTLAGANNPAGRLPVTFYRSVDQLPGFENYSMKGRTYRYFTGQTLYNFAFGLSYSRFQYSNLRTQRTSTGARVSVRLKNDSSREGDEVVQLYVDGGGGPDDPIRNLRGFQRVHLRAGESRDVEFTIPAENLPKGRTRLSVGGGQPVGSVPHVEGTL